MKNLTFDKQILLGVAFLLLMEICSTIFRQGILVNIAWVVYGLMFIIHPVFPEKAKEVRNIRRWVRAGGALCIIVGIITRFGVPR